MKNLLSLYQVASVEPSVVNTCPLSITTDTLFAILWVHWVEIDPKGRLATLSHTQNYASFPGASRTGSRRESPVRV
jgi:hypothetical protein